MAVGLQFRMKGLSKGEPKSMKQLRKDGQALLAEHPDQVCVSEDDVQVEQAADLLFRTYNMVD